MSTYTGRHHDPAQVTKVEHSEDWSTIHTTGWSFGHKGDALQALREGDHILVEVAQSGRVAGVQIQGAESWLFRLSDEDLVEEHRKFVEARLQSNIATLEANRDDWNDRTKALPEKIRDRLDGFLHEGGYHYEVEGWGYELAVSELAALYLAAATGDGEYNEDDEEIAAYARLHGTSGNQHAVAKLIATVLRADLPATEVPAALMPLGADPHYRPKE